MRVMANRAMRSEIPIKRPVVYEKLGKRDIMISSNAATV